MPHKSKECYDIIMTGYVAAKGTSLIAKICREYLTGKIPKSIVKRAEKLYDDPQCRKPDNIDSEVRLLEVGEGGIFRALWKLADLFDTGFVADINKMRIRQETIEVTECFDINPYKLCGDGSYLLLTKYAGKTLRELEANNIEGNIIGYTKGNNDKIIINGDETRYLESRFEDEIIKIRRSQHEGKDS